MTTIRGVPRPKTPQKEVVNRRLGQAIKTLMQGRTTQTLLAADLGVEQTTISRWQRGVDAIPAYRLPQIETILGIPGGAIWSTAGYTETASTIAAIYSDSRLGTVEKETLRKVYESLV